jgi:hypothetical protein
VRSLGPQDWLLLSDKAHSALAGKNTTQHYMVHKKFHLDSCKVTYAQVIRCRDVCRGHMDHMDDPPCPLSTAGSTQELLAAMELRLVSAMLECVLLCVHTHTNTHTLSLAT